MTKTIRLMKNKTALAHIALPLLLSLMALIGCLYRVYAFSVNDWDYGIFSNLMWNFANGNGWLMSLYDGEVRVNFLADHLVFLTPVFSLAYKVFSSPYTLSLLHGMAFAAVFFLAPILVREIWAEAGRDDYLDAAVFLLLVLAASKGFNAAWRFQSHMTTLGMPFILLALISLHRQNLARAAIYSLIAAMAQERAAVAVFGIGMYAFLITGNRILGASICAFSCAYFMAAVKIIIPSFYNGKGGYIYNSLISPFVDIKEKIIFLLSFVMFWMLLPLAGRRAFLALLCAMPVLALGLVSNRKAMYGFIHQYQDLPSIFFMAAGAHGLLWLAQRRFHARISRNYLLAAAFCCIMLSALWGWRNLPLATISEMTCDREVAALNHEVARYADIPAEVSVFATSGIGPRLSLRERRYHITPERAARPFRSSMIFVAPKIGIYPYASAAPVIEALNANSSIDLVSEKSGLLVYRSKDLH